MHLPSIPAPGRRPVLLILLGLAVGLSPSCRREKPPERVSIEKLEVVVPPQLEANRLSGIDGMLYRTFADSPIHWQPFEPDVLKWADQSKRLIFCVVARPQHPDFFELMRELEADPQVVELINNSYVPVLLDADVAREFGFLSAILCGEVGRSISFPMYLWLNKAADPVACTPVSSEMIGSSVQIFNHAHAMIAPTWEDDLERWMANGAEGYVIKNSRHDQIKRVRKAKALLEDRRFSEQPEQDVLLSLERLASKYDDFAKDFSGAGDMVPTGIIRVLAETALQPGVPDTLRQRCRQVVSEMVRNFLTTPMIDPIDGGVFSLRTSGHWELPAFTRNCVTQVETAEVLLLTHQASSLPGAKEAALRLIAQIENSCSTPQGLFALSCQLDTEAQKWTWTTEEVLEVLGEEDARWWIQMTGMNDLGNLPVELDPAGRGLFRRNVLRQAKPASQMAASLGVDPAAFQQRLEAARGKLLAARNERLRGDGKDESPHLVSSFGMVSLYVSAYRATSDAQWLEKAVQLHQRCRSHFLKGDQLLPYGAVNQPSYAAARAYHHAVALRAAMDLASIAPDKVDAAAIAALHLGQLSEQYLEEGLLLECASKDQLLKMPIEDGEMTFGDSTVGVLSAVAVDIGAIGIDIPENLRPVLGRLPQKAISNPIIYTDTIEAVLSRLYPDR